MPANLDSPFSLATGSNAANAAAETQFAALLEKHPVGQLAPHGCKSASTDCETIGAWWDLVPEANVALATGHNVFVVDCDGDEGVSAWHGLQQNHCVVEGPFQLTGGGGEQWFFEMPDLPIRNAAKLHGLSIDIRGIGRILHSPAK